PPISPAGPLPPRHARARASPAAARSRAGRSCQVELVSDRRKMRLDVGLADLPQRRWPPLRRLVLVDDHRTDSLIEIMPPGDAGNYSEFGAHALVEIEAAATAQLRQRDLEAQRRLGAHGSGGGAGKGHICASGCGLGVESCQDVLDPIGLE